MRKRLSSLLLCFCIVTSLVPPAALAAETGASGTGAAADTDMDALTALGIDTGAAPQGYDPNSRENPFGKDTITIAPVYELYQVGLSAGTVYDKTSGGKGVLEDGSKTESHSKTYDNTLTATLYGHEQWSGTTAKEILEAADDKSKPKTIASGTTTAAGTYTKISTGTSLPAAGTEIPYTGYWKGADNATTDLGGGFRYALSQVAAGNFTGGKSGLSAQTVMVYTSSLTSSGGLYLRFGDAATGEYGGSAKQLLSTGAQIGNPSLTYTDPDTKVTEPVENFAEAPYQLQNYLQVATGDWNGDGMDEVAVYIPEVGKSRIVVYALQLMEKDDRSTAYQNPAKWASVWTYYFSEGDVVSNMVSLTSGDVNKDGLDDLAATWGYYYGPTQNKGSKAVVMFGAKGTSLFTKSQQFDLTYGSSNLVRAGFAFGDLSGGGSAGENADTLILCGQSDADLKDGNTATRYVALFDWNGSSFTSNIYQNFDLFDKEDGKYTWTAMTRDADQFYSLPLCAANTALISQGITGGGDLLYFDSLIIAYTEKGLSIQEAWDNQPVMQDSGGKVQYVEYGAAAGALTGDQGTGTLFTMTQTLSSAAEGTATYSVDGAQRVPIYQWSYYYKNWLYKLFGIKTWYSYISGYDTVAIMNAKYEAFTPGSVYRVAANPSENNYYSRTPADFSTAICLANTDSDSSYMNYSGKHRYTYTDPEVLAVLASPPYFSDLMNRDDLSGNYAESTTTYSKSKGSGTGSSVSATISVGAYVAYEQDIKVFGITVASVEAEAAVTGHFTFDTEQTSTLEQTITYTAAAGEDMVAFYSIPMEIYEYTSYVPDGMGGCKEVLTTVNIPHEAAVRLLSLEEYEAIAKDYRALPTIAANALTHTVGDPATYPSGTGGYQVIAQYGDDPSAVGYSGTGGGAAISQEIAMSEENQSAFTASAEVEAKVGAGAGGFKVGVIAGAEAGAGTAKISTSGSSFSGEMQNMPIEAKPYGYQMNWKIFCYRYQNGGQSFPVVSYLVSDVRKPPTLPADFQQDIVQTTDDSLTLTWSYDKMVAGFNLYRYYEFPEGSGSYQLTYVPFSKGTYNSGTGTYSFQYADTGLSPYTEYQYQIQTVRAAKPDQSICSEPMVCRTKTKVGYPALTLNGLNEKGQMPIYPDADGAVRLSVADAGSYEGLGYQWQKKTADGWQNLSGQTKDSFTISNAGSADSGSYRCRVNAIYYDKSTAAQYYISAYSDVFQTSYDKRTPTGTLLAENKTTTGTGGAALTGLSASIKLYSANTGHTAAPSGNVTFTVTGTDYQYSETVSLAVSGGTEVLGGTARYYATAGLNLTSLPTGVYTVSAYYGGSRVFKDMETTAATPVVVGNATAYRLALSAAEGGSSVTKLTFGDRISIALTKIEKDAEGKVQSTPVSEGVRYELVNGEGTSEEFTSGGAAPDVGSYTMQATVNGAAAASLAFTVVKKAITVSVESQTNVGAGTVSEHPPVIAISDAGLSPETLKLSYTALNSAGNATALDNDTDPGNYTVTARVTAETPESFSRNYDVTYPVGTYTIVGALYRLTAEAVKYTDLSGTRPVGTVGISSSNQLYADYTAGTNVVLYATPQDGYEVAVWTAAFEGGDSKTQKGGTTYTVAMQAAPVKVTVTFQPAAIRLFAKTEPAAGGVIACADANYSSGAYVSYGAEYSFTAAPAKGYHFSKWRVGTGTGNTVYSGTQNPDGTSSLDVTVGKTSMTVFAVFERDSYTLTLDGEIQAYYWYDDDGNATTPEVKRMVASGGLVPGDTQVTVEPKTGCQAAEGAFITVNGTPTEDSASHAFLMAENTAVSLETVRNAYRVTVEGEHGTVSASLNGTESDVTELSEVDGGSALAFTARADRGYVFDHWTVTKDEVGTQYPEKILTIPALGANLEIAAVFAANEAYTLTARVSDADRGGVTYSLTDLYGGSVAEREEVPAGGVTLYKGETLTLYAAVNMGSMVEQWEVNGENTYTTHKTYEAGEVTDDLDITVYLKAASSYAVYFVKMGEDGSTLTATADGRTVESGDLTSGGSTMQFTAQPEDGFMVDFWTVTEGNLETEPAEEAVEDARGKALVDPVYIVDSLAQNMVVRVYFTAEETVPVALPDDSERGESEITCVTPIDPADDGDRNETREDVRAGGTVRISLRPAPGYAVNPEALKDLLEERLNGDAAVSVEEAGDGYLVVIANLRSALTLEEEDLYAKRAYTITVPKQVSASSPRAVEGELVTLTVTPPDGYRLSNLTLDYGALKETVSSSLLTYTFDMPGGNVTVTTAFEAVNSGGDGGGGGGGGGAAEVPPAASTGIPVRDLTRTGTEAPVTVENDVARVVAPSNMLAGLAGIVGKTAAIEIAAGDKTALHDQVRQAVGERPLITLSLLIDGVPTAWSNPDAPVTVSIPYAPTAEERAHPESIIVWYLDGQGSLECVPNGRYDEETGRVVFTTTHFSGYAVGYRKVSFRDVSADAWYGRPISFLAARGITTGIGNDNFGPEDPLSRGQFIVMLMKAYAISPDADSAGNFGDAGSAYYTGYLAAAKRLGISRGVGGNLFQPEKQITRQEMFTLLYSTLNVIGQPPQTGSGRGLEDFSDAGQVAPWAAEAMTRLTESGLISGSGGALKPADTTTRAEMAQVLYNLMKQ